MSNRPEYPIATALERCGYAVLAAATGLGLLIAVVAAFQSQVADVLASPAVVAAIACAPQANASPACLTAIASAERVMSR